MSSTCTLILKDEVNCQFVGLPKNVTMEVMKAVQLIDPKAKYTPQGRLGIWNGVTNYANLGGNTYINLLEIILPVLERHNISIELVDNRKTFGFNIKPIDENLFSDIKFADTHFMAGKSIILREHQVEAVNKLLEEKQGILLASTSSGKTLICAALSKAIQDQPGGKSLIIVPSSDLVQQTYNDYELVGLDCGMYSGSNKDGVTEDGTAKHIICTWQSLEALVKREKELEEGEDSVLNRILDGLTMVIVDETHTASGECLQNLLNNVLKDVPLRFGLTGTMPKSEIMARKINCSLGFVIHKITAKELMEKGILSQLQINVMKLKCPKYAFKTYQDEMQFLSTDEDILRYTSTVINDISETGNTLVLVDRIETGLKLCEMLGLPESQFVSGSTSKKKREEQYASINDSNNKILIATFSVASTGISISRLFNVFIYNGGKSYVKIIQSIGRGLRLGKDKNSVNIIDFSTNHRFSRRHLNERIRFYKEVDYPYTEYEIKDWNKKK